MKRLRMVLLAAALVIALCGCGHAENMAGEEGATAPPKPTLTPAREQEGEQLPMEKLIPAAPPSQPASADTSPLPELPNEVLPDKEAERLYVSSLDEIRGELEEAIFELQQPPAMDVSSVMLSESLELDVKNLYHELLGENRALCYAYDLTAVVSDEVLTVEIAYMPYVTGQYPDGFSGVAVSSLGELLALAEENLGVEPVNLCITDRTLTPDDMNIALQQVGGGYIVCALSRDATALTFAPTLGLTMEDCQRNLSECDELAQGIVASLLSDEMGELEKAKLLYGYLTENVKYDNRYYTDRANMPDRSQTAYGALHDGVAICGGYSHALKLLFEKAGIACYCVCGQWGSEAHMWNTARINGDWVYFDATGDRGVSQDWWNYCGVDADELTGHTFDPQRISLLQSVNEEKKDTVTERCPFSLLSTL